MFAVFSMTAAVFANSYDIVVNESVAINSQEKYKLKLIFSGKMRYWPDGKRIQIVTFSFEDDDFLGFCSYLDIYPRIIIKQWNSSIYTGSSGGPIRVSSYEEMLNTIKSTSGAVGYFKGVTEYGDGVNVIDVK
ncbi:MAG: hypothetical protein D6B27_05825 [Gammaproteobacteria bacterium]|nr:MAG: hypothetical protein D6B27_05825 [Gammaproteobacteria bacterium]